MPAFPLGPVAPGRPRFALLGPLAVLALVASLPACSNGTRLTRTGLDTTLLDMGCEGGRVSYCLALAAAVALCGAAQASAASVVSPTAGSVITATHVPIFTIAMDATRQADGEATEHDPLIAIEGKGSSGQATVVAFCKGADNGDGTWSCSDPVHPLSNGLYLLTYTYSLHTCISVPGPFNAPPSCSWYTMPGVGAVFTVSVPTSSPPKAITTTPVVTPTVPSVKKTTGAAAINRADTSAPHVTALSTKVSSTVVTMRWKVSDNSGRAASTLSVRRGASIVAKRSYTQKATGVYTAKWKIGLYVGLLRFCVSAKDAAGNVSAMRCASFTVS